ncbi:MAG: hypothetical protein AB7E79_15530 [Rhodospirillaceae bacterium]
MGSAGDWVRQIVARSTEHPMTTEEVLKSLERHAGTGERALIRVQAVLEYIDAELVERRGGHVMRDLWNTVADYQEKVQEAQAAA